MKLGPSQVEHHWSRWKVEVVTRMYTSTHAAKKQERGNIFHYLEIHL
jgi:hypothetical protein